MKFNSKIKIGNIEVEGVVLNNIELELGSEYNLEEAKGAINLIRTTAKEVIKELPELFRDLKAAYDIVEEIDKEVDTKEEYEDFISNKRRFMDTAKTTVTDIITELQNR